MIKPELHDTVQLKDGRQGTVLHVYADGFAVEAEFEDPSGETVELSDVVKIVKNSIH